jgi:hypothetical protein
VALAASLSTVTAGCLSSLPPLGGDQRYGRLGVPPAGDPAYRRWLPAPSRFDPPVEQYHFAALRPTGPRPDAPELFVARRAHQTAQLDYFGIGFESYDRLVDSSVGSVVEASFDRASVVRTVSDSGYERTGEYRGYGVFARTDVPRRVAVGDGVVAWTSAYHHDRPDLEALLDAGAGVRPRYHEASAAFERLTAAAGGNPYLGVNVALRDPTGRPAMVADALRFDGDHAYQVVHYYYTTDSIPTKRGLESALHDDSYRFVERATSFDVQFDGRLATVETRVPLRPDRDPDPRYDLPQVTWGVTHDAPTRVTFRHEAGESVPAERLHYDVHRPAAPGNIELRPLWTDATTVEAGAEATVDLRDEPNATGASLVYSASDVGHRVLFGVDLRGGADG